MRRNIFNYVVGITLILGVLGFFPNTPSFRGGKFLFLEIMVMTFLSLYFIKNKWLRYFFLWNILSVLIFMFCKVGSSTAIAASRWSMNIVVSLKFFLLFVLFYETLKDKLLSFRIVNVVNVLCIIAIAQATLMIVQASGVWFVIVPMVKGIPISKVFFSGTNHMLLITKPLAWLPTGFLSNPNMAASTLALCLPMFFRKKWCWCIPLLVIAVLVCKSLGGIIPMAVCFIIWVYFCQRKYFIPVMLGTVGALLFFIFKFDRVDQLLNGSGRFPVWNVVITKFIKLKPIIGYGFGSGATFWKEIQRHIGGNVMYLHPHNEFLSVAVESGLVGLAIVVGFLSDVIKKSIELARKDYLFFLITLGLLMGILNSGVNFLFHTNPGIIFLVYVVIVEKRYNIELLTKRRD